MSAKNREKQQTDVDTELEVVEGGVSACVGAIEGDGVVVAGSESRWKTTALGSGVSAFVVIACAGY